MELDELQAMQECIASKATLEAQKTKLALKNKDLQLELQNLLAGKKGIKTILAGGNKDDKQLII